MFKTTSSTGFHITFANGYTVSVQWAPFNYATPKADGSSPVAEVAIMDLTRNGEDYLGVVYSYQTPEEVTNILTEVARASKIGCAGTPL